MRGGVFYKSYRKIIKTYSFIHVTNISKMVKSQYLIELYNVYKIFVKNKFDGKEVSITYWNNRIEFSSSKEAGEKFEALVNETLSYYDKLGVIAMHDTDFKNKRDTLINICAEVRTLRWRNEEL